MENTYSINKNSKIYIAGHTGFVGSAFLRKLKEQGYSNLILRTSTELNLLNSEKTEMFFAVNRPEYVIMCAGVVGGVKFNIENMIECFQDNMMMLINVIKFSHKFNVKNLTILGSNCMYPKGIDIPITEDQILKGDFEPTNEGFALAKVSAMKLIEYYRKKHKSNFTSIVPCNLYGINDCFDLNNSHLISALIQKMHRAKTNDEDEVELWGTGEPRREFLYVDDLVDAYLFLMANSSCYDDNMACTNVGLGFDLSIKEIAKIVANVVGYNGNFYFNTSYSDGIKRKLLNSSKINSLGWHHKTSLEEGVKKTYEWFLSKNNK